MGSLKNIVALASYIGHLCLAKLHHLLHLLMPHFWRHLSRRTPKALRGNQSRSMFFRRRFAMLEQRGRPPRGLQATTVQGSVFRVLLSRLWFAAASESSVYHRDYLSFGQLFRTYHSHSFLVLTSYFEVLPFTTRLWEICHSSNHESVWGAT